MVDHLAELHRESSHIGESNKIFKEKSFKESQLPGDTYRPVLASKSLNSEYEPACAIENEVSPSERKRPASKAHCSSSLAADAKKPKIRESGGRASLLSDIYLDSAELEDELTEDDEDHDEIITPKVNRFLGRPSIATPLTRAPLVKGEHTKEASSPRWTWQDMTELDFPAGPPTQLPAIDEDVFSDIIPACTSISPPIYIPRFIGQVDYYRSRIFKGSGIDAPPTNPASEETSLLID